MGFIYFKNRINYKIDKWVLSILMLFFMLGNGPAQSAFPDIVKLQNGKISCVADSLGNQIPDFSYAGYQSSEAPIPNVEIKIFVPKQDEDATQIIQSAIDYVGSLKPDVSGFRGAVLLDKGTFKISGTLYIKNSGVVLRGSGNDDNESILLGTGIKREAMIRVLGVDNKKYLDTLDFGTSYTPLGSKKIQLNNVSKLKVSDEIMINKPLSDTWIKALKMEEFGGETGWIGWKTGDWDIA